MACEGPVGSHFQVRVTSRSLIKASNPPAAPHVLLPSNLDLINAFPVAFISVYPRPPAGDFASVVATIRASLPAFLNRLFPLAGRILPNPATGLPEIHCNNAGAELVVGQADVPLAGVDFHDVDSSIDRIPVPFAGEIAFSVQAVGFACGGFSVTFGTNHLLVDGYGAARLHTLWSELLRTGRLSVVPSYDGSLLRPRAPPTYGSALGSWFTPYTSDDAIKAALAGEVFVRRLYRIDAEDISRLRSLASEGARRATQVEAVSAYLWKAFAGVVAGTDERCQMAWLVEVRKMLGVQNFWGNAFVFATSEASVAELERRSLSDVAEMASAVIRDPATGARLQEVIDWVEDQKKGSSGLRVKAGRGSPAMVVSSFVGFDLEADFGFGRPVLWVPSVLGRRMSTTHLVIVRGAAGDGSWIVNAYLQPKLAAKLESDAAGHVFKRVTAEYLGLVGPAQQSRL